MKVSVFLFIVLLSFPLQAKEVFTKETIAEYMTKENPYLFTAIGQEFIYREKERYALGSFDTKLSAKYDKKEYPVSTGEYLGVSVDKPIENGMEFSLGYRKAQGTQEYNNIKTSNQGEMKVGVKIPVFSVVHDMSKRKLDLYNASLQTSKYKFKSKDNLRLLYFKITSVYSKLLYSKSVVDLEQSLEQRAKTRKKIIEKKVLVGEVAKVAMLEASQQLINRHQRVVSALNIYENNLENFVKYLNISKSDFLKKYDLQVLSEMKHAVLVYAMQEAIENRADLKMYDYEVKQIDLKDKQTSLLQYPKFNVSLYGVHDFKYENGFKVALDMDFPFERRKYEAASAENKIVIKNLQKTKEKKILDIRANLTTIHNSLRKTAKNIDLSEQEVALVKELETVEHKKYKLGISNLFMLNQREIYTLTIKKKLLKYQLDYLLLEQELQKERGDYGEIFLNL